MTRHLVPLAAGLFLLGGASCGGGGSGGSGAAGFQVATVVPADGAQLVPRDVLVHLTFTHDLDPASVGPTAITLGVSGVGAVSGIVSIVAPDALDFAPMSTLRGGTTHFVQVNFALKSATGEALAGDRSFAFLTAGSTSDVVLPSPAALQEANGRLVMGRRDHAATLLQDGRVLITGGFTAGTAVTDRAEIFNQSTETFTMVAEHMRRPRAGHTATRLPDGRVLLVGGWYESAPGSLNADATAEIFDPASAGFIDAGAMSTGRAAAAAIPLADGRVLVTGGTRPLGGIFNEELATVEVWAGLGTGWSAWPYSMSHTRAYHGAVDLTDGRWLLAAGSDVDFRPELFDTATGLFTAVAPAAADGSRYSAAVAAFADGDVAVAGGDAVGSVLHFSRSSSTMLHTGSGLNAARSSATASPIGPDRILVAGGIDYSQGGLILASCDLVAEGGVAGSRTFATAVRFTTGIANHTATVLSDGRILFAGGLTPAFGGPESDAAYIFTP